MDPISRAAPIVRASTRDSWRPIEHQVLNRRVKAARMHRGRRPRSDSAVCDAIETRRGRRRSSAGVVARLALFLLVSLAIADLVADAAFPALREATNIAAVLLAGAASLLALIAAEPAGMDQVHRWHLQAVASAVVMFMLMANPANGASGDPLWFLIVVGVASTLVAMATHYSRRSRIERVCLALDSAIVGFTTLLITLALANTTLQVGGAAILIGAFAAAGFAIAVATRPSMRANPRGSDTWFLGGVLVLCVGAAVDVAGQIGLDAPRIFATPGVALMGALGLARSAWPGRGVATMETDEDAPSADSRLRLLPAIAAAGAIVVLSWAELDGRGTRAGFFGIIVLFGFIVSRLTLTLVENRQLLQRVERSGLFEEKLRDIGGVLVEALDRRNTLEIVCRAARLSLGADSVLVWMLDPSADELEVVEVLSAKREALQTRRLSLRDPTSLASRVARTGQPEIVSGVPSASAGTNGYLNVLLHTQALLAVPVIHGGRVQGVFVCVNSRSPTAYGQPELAKAELLASQVAVALDNAYQHALQRRRLEELTALYQFAQLATAAQSSVEIVRQLLPILRERLNYTFGTIWLRDETTGTLRLGAGEGPTGAPMPPRPPALAMRAFSTSEPASAGLDWDDSAHPPGSVEPCAQRTEAGESELAVPMVLKRRVVGVVHLKSRLRQAWSPTEQRLVVALANHAALAADNLHLLDEARKVAALKELDRMKTELLGTVSHELRTPLSSIKGYATTLLTSGNKLPREEQREFLEIIDSEADRLRELIENLLDLSRLEAGVLRIDMEPVRLASVAREVTRKVQLAAPNHELALDWPTSDPLVNADRRRIYQVIQNLLTNAVKYAPDGGCITLRARCERRDLVVSVTDQGLGMPATELDKIFDRFHRVPGQAARRIGGTGLGLAICKGLVEAHGGRIWAESEGEGEGSTFAFTLPLLPETTDVAASLIPSHTKGAHEHQEANRSRR